MKNKIPSTFAFVNAGISVTADRLVYQIKNKSLEEQTQFWAGLMSCTFIHRNPALEDQACDRIYRVGQHRDVTIHRWVEIYDCSEIIHANYLDLNVIHIINCPLIMSCGWISHRFVCEGTVEDKISSLQEKKKELAQKVLSGTGSSFTKLSLADLRVIFGVWWKFYFRGQIFLYSWDLYSTAAYLY